MPTFHYNARTNAGDQVSGVVDAPSQNDAVRQVQREGKVVTDIGLGAPEAPVDADVVRLRAAASMIKREEVISMTSQLSVMLETGVPLGEALKAFCQQSKRGGLKRVMENVSGRITSGQPFSDAIREFPRVFPPLMVSLMKASEASGKLGMMLGRVSEYLAKERKIVRQIKGALTYPTVMVTMALTVTGFLVVFVLPRFAKIYANKKAALPSLTRFVMNVSDFITANYIVLLVALAMLTAGAISLKFFEGGRAFIDRAKVKAPIVGKMFGQFYLARASRTLGTLLGSGVQLLDAVRIVRGVTGNILWQRLWDDCEKAMTSGQSLTDVMSKSDLIPPATGYMIAAGERTARLPEVFARIADSTEEELDGTIKSVTQLIEPAMIMFMGVVIGGIAVALLLPIFSIASVMSGK
ncbi:MAG: type II secretion system F family protein [Phycisphaerales bacterium]